MINNIGVERLLNEIGKILLHQSKEEDMKGDKFNVFSILRMERKENGTHSAFLGELLNPVGTHNKGNLFLKLFLSEVLKYEKLDLNSCQVILEKYIGVRDIENKRGGRIDIYITDGKNCISIENKIDAGDQPAQLERYCNHKKEKNRVYYLNRFGTKPSSSSGLQLGKDFFLLSYAQDIIKWLELCMNESVDTPILRESIKQYIILIHKITNVMKKQPTEELLNLILSNYEEAKYIASHILPATEKIGEAVRQLTIDKLTERLSNKDFEVSSGHDSSFDFSQIFIRLKEVEKGKLFFGLESFSGRGNYNGHVYVGILNPEGTKKSEYSKINGNENAFGGWWINPHKLPDFEGYEINISNTKTIQKLHADKDFMDRFVDYIVNEVEEYLLDQKAPLLAFLNS